MHDDEVANDDDVGPLKADDDDHHHENDTEHQNEHHDDHDHDHDDHGDDCIFYISPVQRQRWGESQSLPHTNWGDTFFDLFYVAAAYNLGSLIREEPTLRGLLYFVGMFWPIAVCWSSKLYNDARYETGDDIFHRLYEQGVLIAIATAVLHIRPVSIIEDTANNNDLFIFCLSITIGKILCFGRVFEVFIASIRQQRQEKKINQLDDEQQQQDNNNNNENDEVIKTHEELLDECYDKYHLIDNLQLPNAYHATRQDLIFTAFVLAFYVAATIISGMQYFTAVPDDKHADNYYDDKANYNNTSSKYDDEHIRQLASASSSSSTSKGYDDYHDTDDDNLTDLPIWLLIGGCASWLATVTVIKVLCLQSGDAHKAVSVPINIEYCIHRYGEWTMLMLGESVLSLLIVDVVETSGYYKTLFNGVLSVTLLQYLHFRSQPHSPNDHALRRSRIAGITFTMLMQVYSAALIILGASYKMLLYEFVYDNKDDDYNRRSRSRQLLLFNSPQTTTTRFLAAGGSDVSQRFDKDERSQRVAHFFCISMAVVWLCSDIMIFVHKGIKFHIKKNRCERTGYIHLNMLILFLLRVGLIAFIGTLSVHITEPEIVSSIGLAGIITQVILRVVGSTIYEAGRGGDCHHHDDDNHDNNNNNNNHEEITKNKKLHNDDDDDESDNNNNNYGKFHGDTHSDDGGGRGRKWPNTTEPQIVGKPSYEN